MCFSPLHVNSPNFCTPTLQILGMLCFLSFCYLVVKNHQICEYFNLYRFLLPGYKIPDILYLYLHRIVNKVCIIYHLSFEIRKEEKWASSTTRTPQAEGLQSGLGVQTWQVSGHHKDYTSISNGWILLQCVWLCRQRFY